MVVRVKERDLTLEHSGFKYIVRVQETDVISPGNFEPSVTSAGPATIFLVNVFDRAIKLANHFPRRVCGTVVNDNYLEVIESLVQDTLDGFSDQIGSIIRRDNYTYARGAAPVPRGLIQVAVSHIASPLSLAMARPGRLAAIRFIHG